VSAWLWLVGAVGAGAGAFFAGWPAWSASRNRAWRDMNAERYLAWRGRAVRPADTAMTLRERRRLVVAGVLALLAVFCLVGFVTYA